MVIKKKRTEIECYVCRDIIKFPEYVGQDYSGDLACDTCGSSLRIKLVKGEVKEFKVVDRSKEWKGFKRMLKLQEQAAKAMAKPEKNNKAGGE